MFKDFLLQIKLLDGFFIDARNGTSKVDYSSSFMPDLVLFWGDEDLYDQVCRIQHCTTQQKAVLEILVLSLSRQAPTSSNVWFCCTSKCKQVIVLVQSTKLRYMRYSPVYILSASWQPSGQPWGINQVTMWMRMHQCLMGKGRCPCVYYVRKRKGERERKSGKEISQAGLVLMSSEANLWGK